MPWNPETYNKFKDIRYQPFFDLMALIKDKNLHQAIDLGCGIGEQTYILSEKFKKTHFLGIDSSAEMLNQSKQFSSENLKFESLTTEELIKKGEKWDLIFSNAALQWSDNHDELFPNLIKLLQPNGQFAVQMPVQNENILNQILTELADEEPYQSQLKGWNRESSVLSIDSYAKIMFEGGLENIQIVKKVYPIIAKDHQILFDFISGSALIPYLERLNQDQQDQFISSFKKKIQIKFDKFPAIYAFKRLLLYGEKTKD